MVLGGIKFAWLLHVTLLITRVSAALWGCSFNWVIEVLTLTNGGEEVHHASVNIQRKPGHEDARHEASQGVGAGEQFAQAPICRYADLLQKFSSMKDGLIRGARVC